MSGLKYNGGLMAEQTGTQATPSTLEQTAKRPMFSPMGFVVMVSLMGVEAGVFIVLMMMSGSTVAKPVGPKISVMDKEYITLKLDKFAVQFNYKDEPKMFNFELAARFDPEALKKLEKEMGPDGGGGGHGGGGSSPLDHIKKRELELQQRCINTTRNMGYNDIKRDMDTGFETLKEKLKISFNELLQGEYIIYVIITRPSLE